MSFHAPAGAAEGVADPLGAAAPDGVCAPPHEAVNEAVHTKVSAIGASAARFVFLIPIVTFMGTLSGSGGRADLPGVGIGATISIGVSESYERHSSNFFGQAGSALRERPSW
jgi:hypothetical protein